MDTAERRNKIIKILSEGSKPVSGGYLAKMFKVSRQVIVQDIAVLRAGGEKIIATPQGYIIQDVLLGRHVRKVIACVHDGKQIEEELKTIVGVGGKVIDVIVEHPVYGELRGNLMLYSMYDIEKFIKKLERSTGEPLLVLTKGVHLHTIEADSEERLGIIEKELKSKGILIDMD